MVLDALASYVADLLKQVAEEEIGMLLGVTSEIDKMGDNLLDLKNFLADADRRNITNDTVREWVGQLKRAMSGVVGDKIEDDTRALVAQILQTCTEVSHNMMVVAIVGVGGIGKTTLAQKVFNDEVIKGEFSKKIWLSVNQNFNEAELLRRAIVEAGGDAKLAGDAKVALQRTLKDALIGHKTLFIMDDVWHHGAWEDVLKIPFVNVVASGSRVLITTRYEGVARQMTVRWPYHHVDRLLPDDAWSLLKKQVGTQLILIS
ncbi:hypothetical protein ACQ4PT_049249 [Festuca glaucescens]